MASNNATVQYIGSNIYGLYVNGSYIMSAEYSRVDAVKTRLNYIFSDPNRDLDFITPSFANDYYVVSCPLVRQNVNDITYLYDTDGSNGWRNYPEKLYEPTNWSNVGTQDQSAIVTMTSSYSPWVDAILIANKIREAVIPNFASAKGDTQLTPLILPDNQNNAVASVVSSSAYSAFYGHPCQGTDPGTYSNDCGYADLSSYQNILNVTSGSGEVFHPGDLTCALTSTNNWNTLYRNKFLKVTNLSNNNSIVVKATDTAPPNKGVELTYRAWVSIGKPSGSNTVKVELMG